MKTVETPVLFVTFNRPDTTRVVWEMIKKAKPKKLYLSSDGPREKKYEEDKTSIEENRKLANEIDWDCIVKTRFSEENQGCGLGVSGAISWAFENEDRLIILEDDCVPSESFFTLCDTLLQKYANEPRIMHISGTRWNEEFAITDSDFFYTRYAHIWGWATWKRAWQLYDYRMKDWPSFRDTKALNTALCNHAPLIKRWTYLFNNIYNLEKKHTWDYQWQYAILKNNGLCINATKNLVTNIGADGMHSSEATDEHNRERHELNDELRAPAFMHPAYGFDAYHGRKFFLKDRNNLKILYDHAESMLPFLNK